MYSCGSGLILQVHHTYYKFDGTPAWDYPDEALTTLCQSCHENLHFIKRNSEIKVSDKEAIDILDTINIWKEELEEQQNLLGDVKCHFEHEFMMECSQLAEDYFRLIEKEKKDGGSN